MQNIRGVFNVVATKLILIWMFVISSTADHKMDAAVDEWEQIKRVADFTLYTPHNCKKSWKMEMKEPYPLDLTRPITKVRLHYFDKTGQTYMFGIEEHKAMGYKYKREFTNIDVGNHTMKTQVIEEDFKFNTQGE